MIYITNTRNTRIMWTIWAIVMVALLSALSNMAGLPEQPETDPMPWANSGLGCITDYECEGLPDDPALSDNIHLSITQGE